MGKQFKELTNKHQEFILEQKIYFVGTAASTGKVNISPKGMDSFRILNAKEVVWLNFTGSGNETSAHVQESPRMTIMFCAFNGRPEILRIYGQAQVLHQANDEWSKYIDLFPKALGARQIFILDIELVQSSCGYAVPLYSYEEDRAILKDWAENKGTEGIEEYWVDRNQISLDGKETNIQKLSNI